MNPPPPRLPALGCVTASANPVATAASTAFPPFFKISIPTFDAFGSIDTTAPCSNDTGAVAGCRDCAKTHTAVIDTTTRTTFTLILGIFIAADYTPGLLVA